MADHGAAERFEKVLEAAQQFDKWLEDAGNRFVNCFVQDRMGRFYMHVGKKEEVAMAARWLQLCVESSLPIIEEVDPIVLPAEFVVLKPSATLRLCSQSSNLERSHMLTGHQCLFPGLIVDVSHQEGKLLMKDLQESDLVKLMWLLLMLEKFLIATGRSD